MNSPDHLQDGYLPGWPGRTIVEITGGGTYIWNFIVADCDETFQNTYWRMVTIERESHDNFLKGKRELWRDVWDCTQFYACFVWQILLESQKRAIYCLRGYGKMNFTHTKKTLS